MRLNQENRIWKLVMLNMGFFGLMFFIAMVLGVPSGNIFKSFTSDIFSLYTILGVASLFIINIIFIYEVFIKKKDEVLGDGLLIVSQGEKPATDFFLKVNNMKLLFSSLIIMSALSIIVFYFSGTLGEKVVSSESPLISLFLIVFENLFLATFIAIIVTMIRAKARSNNWTYEKFKGLTWVSVIIASGVFGVVEHMYAKSFDLASGSIVGQTDLIYTALFWIVIGITQLIMGSMFFGIGLHFIIDLPFYLNSIMSEFMVMIVLASIILLSGYMLFNFRNKGNIAIEKNDTLETTSIK